MAKLSICLLALFLLKGIPVSAEEPLTAEAIMARVAANQDRAVELRSHYIYQQHIHGTSRKTNGKLMREETQDLDVFPTADGTERKLQSLLGRYWHNGKYEEYKTLPVPDGGSLDAAFTHEFLNNGDRSKDGMMSHLFPLTSERQKDYQFELIASERLQGRQAYRIRFKPKNKQELDWAGEAYIDQAEFQPVYVFTKPSRKIPFFARAVMGVDLPGVGFSVQYVRQDEGVWFPQSFGTEFQINLFHVFRRKVSVSLKNSGFKKTHVDTRIDVPAFTE